MQDYRRLFVWQKAHKPVLDIYMITKSFSKDELYGVTSQLRRTVVSNAANIVDGAV
jgi:four helix bundle protein